MARGCTVLPLGDTDALVCTLRCVRCVECAARWLHADAVGAANDEAHAHAGDAGEHAVRGPATCTHQASTYTCKWMAARLQMAVWNQGLDLSD